MNEIKGALEELNAAFQAAGQAVYNAQAAQPAGEPAADAPKEPKKEEVADADYEIVDEAKK